MARQEVEVPADARQRRDKKPKWSTQPAAELRVSWHRHGFVTNWGLGIDVGVICYFILTYVCNEKTKLNFHLLLPYVDPYMRALFKHDFRKGKGGLSCISGAFQWMKALMTSHKHQFSRWLYWGGNGRAII